MSDNELCYLSAVEALRSFRDKKLSPVELMRAVIERAEAVEPTINAFTYTYFDEAMAQAKAAEAKYAKGDGQLGALEGLPVAVKDEGYIKGLPTSNGSLLMKDFVPDTTSPVNQRVLDAGAIVHARTATPEFSCAGFTHSRLWGVTRNPWNPEFTSGGSSGGSSASLAAGTSTLATGSDIGGSIRIPASTCGLVGYKPPYGRNPEDTPLNLDYYCHSGPLARHVQDSILLQNVMCGPHPKDIASLRPKLELPSTYEPIDGWKIAYSNDLGSFEVDKDVLANLHATLDVFRSLGATVEEVDLGWSEATLQAGLDHLSHIFGAVIGRSFQEHGDKMTTYARYISEQAMGSTPELFLRSMEVAGEMYATLGPILEENNLFVCPTNSLAAIKADFDLSTDTIEINGKVVDNILGWVMTTPFNTMSRCPVISMPSGRAANGVPTGVQLVARTYCDADAFQAAAALEAVEPWFTAATHRPEI